MQNRYRNQKPSAGRYKLISIILALVAFGLHWMFANSTRPIDSLAKAIEQINSVEILDEDVAYLLSTAAQDELLSAWSQYYTGLYLERRGEFPAALETLKAVDLNSPASLLAQVAILRINGLNDPSSESHRLLGAVETKAQELQWRDVIAEIQLLRAKDMLRAEDLNPALTLLNTIRRTKVDPRLVEEAKKTTTELLANLSSVTPAIMLEQATLLNREGQHQEALGIIESLKNDLAPNSKAYFETMLVEDTILRSMQRGTEADHVLLTTSANGGEGTADEALFRIAKNHWNINDHRRALEFIDNFYNRFPNSEKIHDVRYMEARILEEINEAKEAIEVYKTLSTASTTAKLRYAAVKRLAWLNELSGNDRDAQFYFNKAYTIATQAFKDNQSEGITHGDLLHARYWEAVSLEKLGKSAEATEAYSAVFNQDPLGYYRGLAAQKLNRSIFPVMQNTQETCQPSIAEQLSQRLLLLKEVKLYSLITREIDWTLLQEHKSMHKAMLPRALLFGQYASPDLAIRSASHVLNNPEMRDANYPCHEKLFLQSFPLAFQEFILPSAESEKIDPALVFAIARTESHFIPDATSVKNARGLMQLMSKTASEEGLQEGESLQDPAVNIRLGTKHLRRLFGQYPESAQAIAAYNAGSGPVNRWVDRNKDISIEEWIELIGYPETLNYVKSVLAARAAYAARLAQLRQEVKE